ALVGSIDLQGVTKRFPGGVTAVDDVSLTIADGEFMVLVGPSGCGKTTILRMVAGLEEVTQGEIAIGDRIVTDLAPKDRDIAMVFQNYALYPHMNVEQNIGFGMRLRRKPKPEVKRRVGDAAQALALLDYLARRPADLSGGQRQRVAIGRAMVREPQAFLMDEPLSNLDAKLRVQMRTEISRIQRDLGVTMIYVTHDQTEAMTMGDRVAVMNRGVLQQVAAPQEMYDNPANLFVAGFIGSPAMNMVNAELIRGDGGAQVAFGGVRLPIPDSVMRGRRSLAGHVGKRVVIGIRPEDLEDPEYVANPTAGARLPVTVDVREAMGAEVYAHFTVDEPPVLTEDTRDLAADAGLAVDDLGSSGGPTTSHFVARLDPHTSAAEGRPIELHVDMRSIHVFDPETGEAIR
ncbi:MAG TPA: sn-glycerol-3-phosphate ABC transporter ATP-binding protein UgpC, partial [Gaiellales bacterium]|nr:sn-glycerol-3-phosphate ABC transporter ATP-binding protein UgpC [Gaiellales bacterium]